MEKIPRIREKMLDMLNYLVILPSNKADKDEERQDG